ncbi:class I SAM-dependent methyltransferase [Alkalihalophilus lindianensis]|uniref:Class I SAM-dependent methyltransferase n=1 Tax=Alkalihalophilus lindianensis TaxID=1630542 RepID=A0ABU3X4N4_9BACI|nr:class I SAM-dependent methyltransferase [Alkalihalophilus lindianensis]MDV2682852.1 class I SAM-dependent methyltransferase [Alkalihalophilus lindianensis]
MGINFHSKENQLSYTTRTADRSWVETVQKLLPIKTISYAADVGCGGGIYSKALSDMGVERVIGVDFSESNLEGARENCKDYTNVSFRYGQAYETGLEGGCYQLLLERALIHHLEDLNACFKEGYRVLEKDGVYMIQDRTPEDCLLAGSETHIRGYFFECFPKLVERETKRRYTSASVIKALKDVGFKEIEEVTLWETRNVYEKKEQLLKDISERTGRSILHELDDKELASLVDHIDDALTIDLNIVEKDRWTIWKAVK